MKNKQLYAPPKMEIMMQVRISDEERDRFNAAAGQAGMSMSSWIRHVCREACGFGKVIK